LKIRVARPGLDYTARTFWSHEALQALYPEFLFRNHAVIRSSVPLMKAAAEACKARFAADRVAEGLESYLRKHIPEEMNHDEWVLDDLEKLGVRRDDVLKRIPPLSAAMLVGPQYYWIAHVHPIALLGYIAVLEGTPPNAEYFGDVLGRAGIPEAAASNIFLHAKLDPTHRDELNAALDSLPLTPFHHSLMGLSAFQAIDGLTRVVEELYLEENVAAVPVAGAQ
jgi:hypothetical protein